MELEVRWFAPHSMRDASREGLIYTTALSQLPSAPGVYVFGRKWGRGVEVLYVGRANDIRTRVHQHLNSNVRLMQHLKQARTGGRVVIAGEFLPKRGQRLQTCLPLIERALIRHFLSEGHDLVNNHGTRRRQHEITSTNRPLRFVPNSIYLESPRTGRRT